MVVAVGCVQSSFDFADGTIQCGGGTPGACPPGFVCRTDRLCYRTAGAVDAPITLPDGLPDAPRPGDAPSVPDAAADARVCSMTETCAGKCGMLMDACGETVDCGTACPNFLGCGVNSPNLCGCPASAFQCFGDVSYQCDPTGTAWNVSQSCGAGLCNGVTHKCATCVPNATRCGTSNDVETCGASGEWPPTDGTTAGCTSQTCVSGACAGVCAPNQIHCIDANHYSVCDATGNFVDQGALCTTIDFGFSCVAGPPDKCRCTTGEQRCNFDLSDFGSPQTCSSSGSWTTRAACGDTNPCCECDGGSGLTAVCRTPSACNLCNG